MASYTCDGEIPEVHSVVLSRDAVRDVTNREEAGSALRLQLLNAGNVSDQLKASYSA